MSLTAIARRLAAGLLVLWLVSVMAFLMVRLIPGDPARTAAGENATAAQVEVIRTQLGLDQPLLTQYVRWLSQVVRGDLGTSLTSPRPVAQSILDALPPTLSIALTALLLAVVIGVGAGLIAGLNRGTWLDRAVSTMTTIGIAVPGFWVAMLLISIFAMKLRLLPATGYTPLSDGFGPWLQHILLPGFALALATAAQIARQARGAVADVMAEPYVRTARARGAWGALLVRRHVLRNAAIPVITVIGLQAGHLLGGVIIVEAVSGVSGIGTLALRAVQDRDYTMIQGYVLLAAVVMVSINLIVDVAYQWVNPKVRTS